MCKPIYQFIRECYNEIPSSIKYTIKRLKSNPDFLKSIQKLRSEGWRDWQILGAIKSIILTIRTRKIFNNFQNREEAHNYLVKLSKIPETKHDYKIPLSEFYSKNLQYVLISSSQKLRMHYDFTNEDIEHNDPFF